MAKSFVLRMAPAANLPMHRLSLVMPLPLKELLEQRADEAGLTMNAFLTRLVADALQWQPDERLEDDQDILRALGVDPAAAARPREERQEISTHDLERLHQPSRKPVADVPNTGEGIDISSVLKGEK